MHSAIVALVAGYAAVIAGPAHTQLPTSTAPGCGSRPPYDRSLAHLQLERVTRSNFRMLGLSTMPTSAAVLANDATCDSVIAAHNALHRADTGYRVTRASLIVKVGTSFFLYIDRRGHGPTTFVYDSAFAFKTQIVEG